MSIFSFDEEIGKLTVNGSCAVIDSEDDGFEQENSGVLWHKNLLSENPRSEIGSSHLAAPSSSPLNIVNGRRRSSVYDKMSVVTPPNTRRLMLPSNEANSDNSSFCSPSTLKKHGLRVLEDFRPIRVLGRGAYGKVLLVKDSHTSRLYAMKQLKKAEILIHEESDTSPNKEEALEKRLERTFAERTILSELEHPNIVKLFYTFHDHHKLYLVLQFIPGGELFYHLKEQGVLDEDTVTFYAAEISSALKFLHSKGIVYRDLKPENCLLDERGHLVLTDFGLSKKSAKNSNTATDNLLNPGEAVDTLYSIIGTPEYCAPEILEGKPYTQNCDWYSLGCLVYDMLTGKPPYTGVNHKVILNKIMKDKTPKIPTYFSEGMKDFLGSLLKKDVTKRWDVDRLWNTDGPKPKKKKAGQAKTTSFQSHFVFRKIDWAKLETGEVQKCTTGPILPIITNWELAENFDTEFTEMRLDSETENNCINIQRLIRPGDAQVFQGFSYVASTSYLERHF
ncbi:LANO_0A04632g1_1 [Lachancea nothofagi CBS 11611]|uniref:LANO_0A04632g1_1 n=1 Tax=Lachancea nothofagi CBS 11611 TaxID=1266666 RepID=A0A1G4IQC3_9SACH|nr:LANO_0A04632g1_1 [Lachancea nothofagi CBS 11611]